MRRALRTGLPTHQHSYKQIKFGGERRSTFGAVPAPGRSRSPQELLHERFSLVLELTLPLTIVCAFLRMIWCSFSWGQSVRMPRPYFSLAGTDDPGFRDRQSIIVAASCERTDRPAYEDVSGHRTHHDFRFHYWIAAWPQRRRVCLLGDDDSVAHSAYRLGRTWDEDFFPRCCMNREPTADFERRGGRVGSCGRVSFRSILVSFGWPHSRERHSSRHVPRVAYGCRRTEVTVLRPPFAD
jgi:hypothetical protein